MTDHEFRIKHQGDVEAFSVIADNAIDKATETGDSRPIWDALESADPQMFVDFADVGRMIRAARELDNVATEAAVEVGAVLATSRTKL